MLYSPQPMHIPDGFLSVALSIILWAAIVAVLAYALRRVGRDLDERKVPLMGVLAAAIFAGQMLNFTVIGGTSGHLMGAALATILLGPWAAVLVMTTVVAVQALIFQDGGLLVLGANIFNMGLLTAAIGYGLYRSVMSKSTGTKLAVAGVAAWLSVMAGALATALQLWLSGTSNLQTVTIAMLGVHALIGIGEALITVTALSFIFRTRPDLLGEGSASAEGGRGWIIAGVVIALIVVLLSPLASAHPDGLERVAMDMGFIDAGQSAPYQIIPDYTLPFLGETPLSTILAGSIGVLIVLGIAVVTGRSLQKKTS